jgi:hypothetical protein
MKAHLVLSEVPLEFGFDLDALCGVTVHHSELVYMWDSIGMGKFESPSSILFCRKCTEMVVDDAPLSRRYVYGVREPKKVKESLDAA